MPVYVFQIAAVIVVAVAALLLFRSSGGAKQQALRRIFMLFCLLVFAFALFFPQAWTAVANFLGIGRGADLLLYLMVFVFLLFGMSVFRKFRTQEKHITELARHLALLQEDSHKERN